MAATLIKLPTPSAPVDLLIIAGEHSGDEHAARLVRNLLATEPGLKVAAVGGRHLKAAGAEQIFDLTLHSVIGIIEVLKNYRFYKELFDRLLEWIAVHAPKNILFVDYPGFNLRLAKQLARRGLSRRGGGVIGTFYYISPQVWAWKAKRRFKIARWIDSLGTLFPFEVDCYRDTTLEVKFVGHPFVEPDFRSPVRYEADGPILLLPGSRLGPVLRIFPELMKVFRLYVAEHPEGTAAVVYPSVEIKELLQAILADFADVGDRVSLVPNDEQASGRAVLTSSGTISLICALAGLPGAIVYRLNPVSYWIGKQVVKIPYIGIENLLLNRPLHPEFIQEFTTEAVYAVLKKSVEDPQSVELAAEAAFELRGKLSAEETCQVDQWLRERMVR